MLRKSITQVVALVLVIIVANSDLLAQKRISFRRGRSSATVQGRIGSKGYLNT